MPKSVKNIAASVSNRLLQYARQNEKQFNITLVEFGHERLIYRLSTSPFSDKYVLKGGMLVRLWLAASNRTTADADFAAIGNRTQETVTAEFLQIMESDAGDGLKFDTSRVITQPLGDEKTFVGVRLKTTAYLGKTRIAIKIDVGLTDSFSDKSYRCDYGSLLELPSAKILAYSPEYVLAEKFQAIINLGLANTRMKDYFDLYLIRRNTEISVQEMREAIIVTFNNRKTEVPRTCPVGLSDDFGLDAKAMEMWRRYNTRTKLKETDLNTVTKDIWGWLSPICQSITSSSENQGQSDAKAVI